MRNEDILYLAHTEFEIVFHHGTMDSITTAQNTIQKSIFIVFCVTAIRHDSSLNKYRKQKQSPP
jgi:hypothetical protein